MRNSALYFVMALLLASTAVSLPADETRTATIRASSVEVEIETRARRRCLSERDKLILRRALATNRDEHVVPIGVQEYMRESERQRRRREQEIWASKQLAPNQKRAAIKEINSKPYYGELYVDVPPSVGEMGVLPAGVTAEVVRVVNEFEMFVDLWWFNQRFATRHHRLVRIHGVKTSGIQEGETVPLRGVLEVIGKERRKDGIEIAVLEPIDVSRYFDRAFSEKGFHDEIDNQKKRRADMKIQAAREKVAADLLKIAKAQISDGYPQMAVLDLEKLLKLYPNTKAADEAKDLLDSLEQVPVAR